MPIPAATTAAAVGQNGVMDISSHMDFAADPTAVFTMLTHPNFLARLAVETGARDHTVDVAGPNTRLQMTMSSPSSARKFIGATMQLVHTVNWSGPAANGSRTGQVTIEVPGMPVKMTGSAAMRPAGKGTVVDYTGDMRINIPMIGPKLEREAAPLVKQAFDAQQRVGDDWLA